MIIFPYHQTKSIEKYNYLFLKTKYSCSENILREAAIADYLSKIPKNFLIALTALSLLGSYTASVLEEIAYLTEVDVTRLNSLAQDQEIIKNAKEIINSNENDLNKAKEISEKINISNIKKPTMSIEQLLKIIAEIESENNPEVKDGDDGRAVGLYQLHQISVRDVNEHFGTNFIYSGEGDMRKIPSIAKNIVILYLRLLNQRFSKKYNRNASVKELLRMYNGGPTGYAKESTLPYWEKASPLT